jgi:hypothetical protein
MKPFLQGKKSLDLQPLRTVHSHSPLPTGGLVRPAAPGPGVEIIKQGDKVMRLIITCSCGERIEVECLYPAGG